MTGLGAFFRRQRRDCTCDGYDCEEFKELKDGRVVKTVYCHHCDRVKERIYYKKEKKRVPRSKL